MTAIAHPDDAQAARRRKPAPASAPIARGASRPRVLGAMTRTFRPYQLSPLDIEILPSEVARDLEYGRD